GLIHHTDRGSQYTAGAYQQVLATHGMTVSMSRAGDCYDNALAESYFATLKAELVNRQVWPTRQAARQAIFEWIEVFYNRQRLHSALGYCPPVTYEERMVPMLQAA
ncbi:MAG: transposase, partial [Chloroflexia bacterium]|nr:transposase [Chloroflexia bacterium]